MKDFMLQRLAFISLATLALTTSVVTTQARECHTNNSFNKDVIVDKACEKIKLALENKDGKVHRVACKFKMNGNTPVEVTTKAYYNEYHKTPDFYSDKLTKKSDIKTDSVIHVTYNTDENYLSLSGKNIDERVALPSNINL
jgi:hypothetical protein